MGAIIELLLITLIVFFVFCAVTLLLRSKRINTTMKTTKQMYRIPEGTITYSDLTTPAKPLFSKRYRLAGKPDYVVKNDDTYIPVEVKSGSYSHPKKNHILQLAAYCYLVEETYQTFVPYGILVYKNNEFKIPFNPPLRFELETVLQTMRNSLHKETITMNHNDPGRCRYCSMRMNCTVKLI